MYYLLNCIGCIGFVIGLGFNYWSFADSNRVMLLSHAHAPVLPALVKTFDYNCLAHGLAAISFNKENQIVVYPGAVDEMLLAMQHMPNQQMPSAIIDRISHMVDRLYSAEQKTQLLDFLAKVAIYRNKKAHFMQLQHIDSMPTTLKQFNLLTEIQDEIFGHDMAAALFGPERVYISLYITHQHEQP